MHYQQIDEKKRMHKGVERDLERLKAKKAAGIILYNEYLCVIAKIPLHLSPSAESRLSK